jgi:hypothetical protein
MDKEQNKMLIVLITGLALIAILFSLLGAKVARSRIPIEPVSIIEEIEPKVFDITGVIGGEGCVLSRDTISYHPSTDTTSLYVECDGDLIDNFRPAVESNSKWLLEDVEVKPG